MKTKLSKLLDHYRAFIDNDAYEEIMHYYTHDEYEMALEGFIIEIISSKVSINETEKTEIIDLAKYYRLDTESVFDASIWDKFMRWIK